MRHNLLHYHRALFLRKKKGYSYKEILAEVPVAKSTLSLWLRNIILSTAQQTRLKNKRPDPTSWNLAEWNRKKRQLEINAIRVKAKQKIGLLAQREMMIAGIMLYWAEGFKASKMTAIANADPVFISFIMTWFRQCLKVHDQDFRISVHYHQGQDYQKIQLFWSQVTGIPLEQFRKPFCKPPGTGHRKHYLQWGVCRVYICRSANLLQQILGWKDGLIKEIISDKTIALRP